MKKIIFKILMLVLIGGLVGCQANNAPNGKQCLDPVNTSGYNQNYITLKANNHNWTNTNVTVNQNSNFYMSIYNSVLMQSQNVLIGYDPLQVALLPCSNNPAPSPKLDTGIIVQAGDLIAVAVVDGIQSPSSVATTQYNNLGIGINKYAKNSILFLQDQKTNNPQYCSNGTLTNCKATNGQGVVLEVGDGSSSVPVANGLNDPTYNFMSQSGAIFTSAIDLTADNNSLMNYYFAYNSNSDNSYTINTTVYPQVNPLADQVCAQGSPTPLTCQAPTGAIAVFQAPKSGNLWLSNAVYPANYDANYCQHPDNFAPFYGSTQTNVYGYNLQISHYGSPVVQAQPATPDNAGAIEIYFSPSGQDVPESPLLTDSNYVVATGPYYNSTAPNNGSTSTVFMRVLNGTNNTPANNMGSYVIDLTTESPDYSTSFSSLMDYIVSMTLPAVQETVAKTYSGIIASNTFQNIIYTLITLYVALYAVYFLFGLTEVSQVDLVMRILKIAVLLALINNKASWEYLGTNFSTLFIGGMNYVMNVIVNGATSASSDSTVSSNLFQFADISLSYMFTAPVQAKLIGLIFSPTTAFIGILMFWNVIIYFFLVIEMLIAYLYAVVIICFLLSLTPFFLACILFEKTQGLFDAWLKNIFYFVLQPIFIFLGMSLINRLIFITFFQMVSYKACWAPMLDIHLPIFGVDQVLFTIYGYMQVMNDGITASPNTIYSSIVPIGYVAQFGFVIFVQFLQFYLYNKMLSGFMGFAAELAGGITNVNASVAIAGKGSFAHTLATGPTKAFKKLTGMDKQARQYRSNAGG